MTMYELWENANASAIDEYASLDAALADVREAIDLHGRDAVKTWGLLQYEERGPRQRVAAGDELIQLALASPARSVAD